MKCLVTGGAGFIGSNIARELLAEGHEITIVDDLSSGYQKNLEKLKGAKFVNGDIRDEATIEKETEGVETIFHLAASVGNKKSIDHPINDAEINVIGTLRILEAVRKNRVKKIVVSSSAGIFGELKTLPIREDHPIEPDSPYGCTKLCEEKISLAYSKLYDIKAACLRYFNVYGINQRFDAYGNVIPIFAFKMLRGEKLTIFGDGEQTRDFINVKDVVQANLKAAMKRDAVGAFNLGSGTRISINALVDLLAETSGIIPRVEYGPKRPGDVRDSLADFTAAKNAFGFVPVVDIKEGLKEYMDWAKWEMKNK